MVCTYSISNVEIGRRLSIARKIAGKTQADAATEINVSRPTIISIENGSRAAKIEKLDALASFYGISTNRLLRIEAVHTDLIPRFRKLPETEDKDTFDAAKLLNNLFSADVELENILGIDHRSNYPEGYNISMGNVQDLADQHAQELRDFLSLGTDPVSDIFAEIEVGMGIRLYQCALATNSKVSGLYAFDKELGACIFLNSNHPRPRRVFSAAHELGHFMGNREDLEILDDFGQKKSRDERYANRFSRAFLMPESSFGKAYDETSKNSDQPTWETVILLAHKFHVSNQDCVFRLEELKKVRKGSWEWLNENGGIAKENEIEVLRQNKIKLDDEDRICIERSIPYRICVMAHMAWKRELLSEGQLSSLLRIGRIELRETLDWIELEEPNIDDIFNFRDK